MRVRRITLSVVGVLMAASVAACGASSHSASVAAQSAAAKAKAVASSTANTAAENQVKAEVTKCVDSVPAVKLLSHSGREQVYGCLKSLVSPGDQAQLESCVATTAASDKIWTKSGRATFEDTGVASCVMKVNSANPTPAPTASK